MSIEDKAEDFAWEKMMEYIEKVGEFYMRDDAEVNAANEIYDEAYSSKLNELKEG